MLPSNPRVGLPSRPRSKSAGPSRRHGPPPVSSLPQPFNPQLPSYSTARNNPQPPAPSPPFPTSTSRRPRPDSPPTENPGRVGSPLPIQSRQRPGSHERGRPQHPLSRTRLVESTQTPPEVLYPRDDYTGQQAVSSQPDKTTDEDNSALRLDATSTTYGDTMWSKVMDVASNLTINVSKALAADISGQDGEDTPPGQDSHLTRVMKAYHIGRARDPSELPSWLFTERERGLKYSIRSDLRADSSDAAGDNLSSAQPKAGGLRSLENSIERGRGRPSPTPEIGGYGNGNPAPSRAADRLKARREAKKGVSNSGSSIVEARIDETRKNNDAGPQRPRIGLPSRPRRDG